MMGEEDESGPPLAKGLLPNGLPEGVREWMVERIEGRDGATKREGEREVSWVWVRERGGLAWE